MSCVCVSFFVVHYELYQGGMERKIIVKENTTQKGKSNEEVMMEKLDGGESD